MLALIHFIYTKYFNNNNTLIYLIEEERKRQHKLIQSILLSIKNTSHKKIEQLKSLPKTIYIEQLILAHIKVLILNKQIKEVAFKRNEIRQRPFICMQYYKKKKCLFKECCFPHITNPMFAKKYCCKDQPYCYNKYCIFIHNKTPIDNINSDTLCSICHEDIKETNKRFGLLQNCDHVYCIDCIRAYRSGKYNQTISMKNRLVCPQCRKHSRFILPSNYKLTGDLKRKNFIAFLTKRQEKYCRYGVSCNRIKTCPFKH